MKALVTGGGGFLGNAIVKMLRQRGDEVSSLSRGHYQALTDLGVEQFQGGVEDLEALKVASKSCDIVFHVAAKAGIWGSYNDFFQTNVYGTENVLSACRYNSISRVVYTSSPSVVFDGNDIESGDESLPYPLKYHAHYPKTKAMAEKIVLSANSPELATVSLRPHLIWGPGDNHLVPRIISKRINNRLRKIGKRECIIDTVYIDNAASAHILAADALSPGSPLAGQSYFITNGEPLPIWDIVNRILAAAGLPPINLTVSTYLACAAGAVSEVIWTIFKLSGEPPITRFVAKELSTSHWFDISKAKKDFGYDPQISINEGLSRLKEHLRINGIA